MIILICIALAYKRILRDRPLMIREQFNMQKPTPEHPISTHNDVWPPPPLSEQNSPENINNVSIWPHIVAMALVFTVGFFIHRILSRHYTNLMQFRLHHWSSLMPLREFLICMVCFPIIGFISALIMRFYVAATLQILARMIGLSQCKHNMNKHKKKL